MEWEGGWKVWRVECVTVREGGVVPEIPSHDFCCAYLERHDVIFLQITRDPFYKIWAINNVQQKPILDDY